MNDICIDPEWPRWLTRARLALRAARRVWAATRGMRIVSGDTVNISYTLEVW